MRVHWQVAILAFLTLLLSPGCSGDLSPERQDRRLLVDLDEASASQGAADAVSAGEPTGLTAFHELLGESCPAGKTQAWRPQTIAVDSRVPWTYTGLSVEAGDTVSIAADGEWTIWQGVTDPFGADGHERLSMHKGCRKGSLIARVGLSSAANPICVGANGSFQAPYGGLVYLAMNSSSSPSYHGGSLDVEVRSSGVAVPEVAVEQAAATDFCEFGPGWVEVANDEVILTLPRIYADSHREDLAEAVAFYGEAAAAMSKLAGQMPHAGARLRLTPDFDIRGRGWILAGNPIRIDPKNLTGDSPALGTLISSAADEKAAFSLMQGQDNTPWEFVRAIGVNASRVKGGTYQAGDTGAQAWGGFFAIYALEDLRGAIGDALLAIPDEPCRGLNDFEENGRFVDFQEDADLQLCLLLQIQARIGWDGVEQVFAAFPEQADLKEAVVAAGSLGDPWPFLKATIEQTTGANLSDLWEQYKFD